MVPFERALVSSYRPSALHSNFSSIFTRLKNIAAFVLQQATFSQPHLQSPQNFPMFPWEEVDGLWAAKSEGVVLIVRAIICKTSNLDRVVRNQTTRRWHCNI